MYFDVQGRPDLHKYLNICFQHSKNKDRKVQHREKDMRIWHIHVSLNIILNRKFFECVPFFLIGKKNYIIH